MPTRLLLSAAVLTSAGLTYSEPASAQLSGTPVPCRPGATVQIYKHGGWIPVQVIGPAGPDQCRVKDSSRLNGPEHEENEPSKDLRALTTETVAADRARAPLFTDYQEQTPLGPGSAEIEGERTRAETMVPGRERPAAAQVQTEAGVRPPAVQGAAARASSGTCQGYAIGDRVEAKPGYAWWTPGVITGRDPQFESCIVQVDGRTYNLAARDLRPIQPKPAIAAAPAHPPMGRYDVRQMGAGFRMGFQSRLTLNSRSSYLLWDKPGAYRYDAGTKRLTFTSGPLRGFHGLYYGNDGEPTIALSPTAPPASVQDAQHAKDARYQYAVFQGR